MGTICKGINSKNLPCKKKATECGYCPYHFNQNPIEFYPQLDNWPTVTTINNNAYHNHWLPGDLLFQLRELQSRLVIRPWELRLSENLTNEQALYCNRLCLISTIELIKLNVKICYGKPCFDNVIDVCAKKIENVQGMADYAEHFKKKCLKSYRDQAKKKLVTFYFNRIEGLCPDVIEKIMTFY